MSSSEDAYVDLTAARRNRRGRAVREDDRPNGAEVMAELAHLRERVRELEALETGRATAETELSDARQRFQYLLAVSPAIIYATQASGDFRCTFVSENVREIMGVAPE